LTFSDAIDDDGVWSYRLTGLGRSNNAQQEMGKQRYAIAPSFSWRPDDKTTFTFLSYFQNDPDAGYYGWLPRRYRCADANGDRLPTDFNEGEEDNKIPVVRKWWVTASRISSTIPLPCVRTCALEQNQNALPFRLR
jgi:hypothetical protein